MSSKTLDSLVNGGLIQLVPSRKGSRTSMALSYLNKGGIYETHSTEVSRPTLSTAFFIWVSDEGCVNPETLFRHWQVPLHRFLMVQARNATEVWRVGLEAIQTGLFSWVFLRPSQVCRPPHLRKLQLSAESVRARVIIIGRTKLPHWMFKASLQDFSDQGLLEEKSR